MYYVISKHSINVLGVQFDSKLNWVEHISLALLKTNKSLNAIRLIKRFFTCGELLQIVTSNVFSIMYYNAEIWHVPCLNVNVKQKLLSMSAKIIRVCMRNVDYNVSFERIHSINKRATPEKIMLYRHALMLYKLYNGNEQTTEWVHLNLNQVLTSRQTKFKITKTNQSKIGLNAPSNRLSILNDMIPLELMNLGRETFKIKMKSMFLG